METETTTPATEAATTEAAEAKVTNCECSQWEIGETIDSDEEGGEPDVTIETTGCTSTTRRIFSPGHDAKLKSLLIRAGVAGLEVRYGRNSGMVRSSDAETAARAFEFGPMVLKGIERGRAKAQAQQERKAARKAAKAAPKPPRKVGAEVRQESTVEVANLDELVAGVTAEPGEPTEPVAQPEPALQDDWRQAQVKVGRWVYDAIIDRITQEATYTDKNGHKQVAKLGKYAEVAS